MGNAYSPDSLPDYLKQFVVEQKPELYTSEDHACWRYILRVCKGYFASHAHTKYLKGLEETGISLERIPLISEMDEKLKRFGWRAVAVSGFIPPSAFMEFQSLGILPIACDMRKLENIAYTPAPDIVHEAAGHAPILSDPDFADYLKKYGEIARKVIHSHHDLEVYHAVRNLSIVKEDPLSDAEAIAAAQEKLDLAVTNTQYISEAAYLARMNWWSAEYGLLGSLSQPKIYGAGLLSSIGESQTCLSDKVAKVPFSIDCINLSYDITRPQPQLFVTTSFEHLGSVLEEFAEMMAYRKGGMEGLAKARIAQTITSVQLESGVQVSGILTGILSDDEGLPCYLQYTGPSQLALGSVELKGHGPNSHQAGYGTPIGLLKNSHRTAADLTQGDLEKLGFRDEKPARLEFESDVIVEGILSNSLKNGDRNLVLSFKHCTVKWHDRVLFQPEWGTYDLACGSTVVSVFGGPADRANYLNATGGYHQKPAFQKSNHVPQDTGLYQMYSTIRTLREAKDQGASAQVQVKEIHDLLRARQSRDWLIHLEILELCRKFRWNAFDCDALQKSLVNMVQGDPNKEKLVRWGLENLANEAR